MEVGEVGEGGAGGFEAVDDGDWVRFDRVLVEEEEAEAAEAPAAEVEGVAAFVVGVVCEFGGDGEGGEGVTEALFDFRAEGGNGVFVDGGFDAFGEGRGAVGHGDGGGGHAGDAVFGDHPGELGAAAAEVHDEAVDLGEGGGDAFGADTAFVGFGEELDGPAGRGVDSVAEFLGVLGFAGGFGCDDADVAGGDAVVCADDGETAHGDEDLGDDGVRDGGLDGASELCVVKGDCGAVLEDGRHYACGRGQQRGDGEADAIAGDVSIGLFALEGETHLPISTRPRSSGFSGVAMMEMLAIRTIRFQGIRITAESRRKSRYICGIPRCGFSSHRAGSWAD